MEKMKKADPMKGRPVAVQAIRESKDTMTHNQGDDNAYRQLFNLYGQETTYQRKQGHLNIFPALKGGDFQED